MRTEYHSNRTTTFASSFNNVEWYLSYTMFDSPHCISRSLVLSMELVIDEYFGSLIVLHNTHIVLILVFVVLSQGTSARFEYTPCPPCIIVVRTALRGPCKSPPPSTQPASHWKPAGLNITLDFSSTKRECDRGVTPSARKTTKRIVGSVGMMEVVSGA